MKYFYTLIVFALGVLVVPTVASAQADLRDDGSAWGIASGAEWMNEYPRFNPMLHDAGVRWLRLFDEWGWIQPKPGEWKWESMDAKVADAKENGMRISGGLWYLAPWATQKGDTRTMPLKDISSWTDYVTAAATRYKGDIKYWEVMNEFNGSFGRSLGGDKAKDYAQLVVAAHDAAKKVDPDARIGLSCANFDLGFFDNTIKAGAADHFQFLCIHPYENVGMAMRGEEGAFLGMAENIRKMLAANKQKTDTPIWITEAGVQATIEPDAKGDQLQAEGIVKLYVLSLAQGIQRIFWFEARGPAYGKGTDHGLIRKDWTPRPALAALKTMTTQLGAEPKYVGWLDRGGVYGFVFARGTENVLVTWAPPGDAKSVTFTSAVKVLNLAGEESPLPANQSLNLTATPVFVTGAPAGLVQEATANASKPFPWGGHYADAESVSCRLSATNIDKGLTQIKPETTTAVHELAESFQRTEIKRNGEHRYVYFRVDSAFASYGTKDLEITFVARPIAPGKKSSFSMTVETMNGYKGVPVWQLPTEEGWHEHTWTINNANFVGGWGWNFRADLSGSGNDVVIKEARVTRITKK